MFLSQGYSSDSKAAPCIWPLRLSEACKLAVFFIVLLLMIIIIYIIPSRRCCTGPGPAGASAARYGFIYMHTCVYIQIYHAQNVVIPEDIYLSIYLPIYLSTCRHTRAHACLHAYMHASMRACTYVCVYVRTYVCRMRHLTLDGHHQRVKDFSRGETP